ncbi:MAG: OB-fold nucleic acid binding domain-containing protein [Candidatus Bathyarchaeia archaeon]
MNISDLKPGMRNVSLKARIVDVSEPRTVETRMGTARVADATIQDETGTVKMSLWDDQIERFSVGDVVSITNGYTTTFRGEMRVNVGRYGKISKVKQ